MFMALKSYLKFIWKAKNDDKCKAFSACKKFGEFFNMNKKQLEIKLSSLKSFVLRKIELEQYQSSSELASFILLKALFNNDIKGKVVADLACCNGIYVIGALLFGAKKVYFLDVDSDVLSICKENVKSLKLSSKAVFINSDVSSFDKKVDTVLMNTPFGVHKRKADKDFLLRAFNCAKAVYSLHKIESKSFISEISAENGFLVSEIFPIKMSVKKSYSFHTKKEVSVDIGLWILRKG